MLSNVDLWNALKQLYPNFRNHTAQWTKDTFTEKGFEALKRSDVGAINEYYLLSLRVLLNRVDYSNAKDLFDNIDFGEAFSSPYGGYLQRIAVNSVKPVNPAWKGLENGQTLDPFVVRRGTMQERFFPQNFDYQSLITIPDESLYKNMFISEYGVSEVYSGFMQALENGWILQKYTNKMECLNAYLNSTEYPLKATQYIDIPVAAETPTADELKYMWVQIQNNLTAMLNNPQSGAYNSLGFESTQNRDSLRFLLKQGYKTLFNTEVLVSAFNPEYLGINLPIAEVPNFGGLKPFKEAAYTTPLYEVYDSLGTVIGYSETEGATTATIDFDAVYWQDPNEDIIGIIADRALIFESTQNGYQVEPIRNPRGLYTNFWASSPNNFVGVDPLYNCLVLRKSTPVSEYATSRTNTAYVNV